jgi:endonuclease YncB( thermonuclease family)
VNGRLVEEGHAWQWSRGERRGQLEQLERSAQRARRGIWTDPRPVAPWVFRREQAAAESSRHDNHAN